MKKIYKVMQASLTARGCGDYWEAGAFSSIKEARAFARSIHKDLSGVNKYPHGYLHTTIEKNTNDDECIIVDSFEYYYN